jgi:hypothetical protein
MPHRFSLLTLSFLLATAGLATPRAASDPGLRPAVEVLVGGSRLPSYAARGTVYIEALKGREYEIRLRNPYPVRVAVALSVDGLNTIDARHTNAQAARKWVLGPYETVTISGWQTSMTHARRFEFTSEEQSYGAWLGKTNDLGVITAVFFRERVPERPLAVDKQRAPRVEGQAAAGRSDAKAIPAGEAGAPPAPSNGAEQADRATASAADEYAATGIGRRTDHAVRQVYLDLDPTPAASVSIRYEYRAQLVRLGVLPPVHAAGDPLDRRERARGFDGSFCPEPKR